MKISTTEKNEMRRDAEDFKRREVYRMAHDLSQRGNLDDYIDFLSENMPFFKTNASMRITSNYKLCPWAYWTKISMGMGSNAIAGFALDVSTEMMALNRVPETLRLIGNIWVDIKQWNVVLVFIIAFINSSRNLLDCTE